MAKVFIFDSEKCNGCRNCQLACKDEHVDNEWLPYAMPQPDTGQFWTSIEEKVRGQVPKVKLSYIAKRCQHCDDAPCMKVAPEAVYKREDGLVIIDPEKAKGKKELVDACPYNAIFWNYELEIPQKCTGCAHLVDAGELPHCVDVCPHQALRFGDEEEFAEEIAQAEAFLPERAELDKPRTYYLNMPKRFVAGIVIDPEQDEVLIGEKMTLQNVETEEVYTTTTDDFGDFWFHQVPAGKYRVYAEAEGYLNRMIEVDATDIDVNVGPIDLYVNNFA